MRLELGSGYNPTPGFYHLDTNPNVPDLDMAAPAFPLPWCDDGSVTEVRAVDVLEHISYWQTDEALAEWARVLAPGGRIFIQVPDADKIMQIYSLAVHERSRPHATRLLNGLPPALPQTPLAGAAWRLLGGHSDGTYAKDGDDWRWNAHYSLWSHESLVLALRTAGLEVESCETNPFPNLQCWAFKP